MRENLFPLVRQVSEDHVVIEIVVRHGGNPHASGLAEAREGRAEPTDTAQLAARFEGHAGG